MVDLSRHVAMVTGASRGVGRGVALGLGEAGATVYITGRTEAIMKAAEYFDLRNSESPQFIGRTIAALATDHNIMTKSGKVLVAAAEALAYGFTDIDGKQPRPLTLTDFQK